MSIKASVRRRAEIPSTANFFAALTKLIGIGYCRFENSFLLFQVRLMSAAVRPRRTRCVRMRLHMGALLAYFFSKLIRVGRLEVECADGTVRIFGNGAGPRLGVRIADRAAEWQIMFDPTLAFGELYMDG